MKALHAVFEGPEWLAGHWAVRNGTVAYAWQLRLEPWADQARSGELAAQHWAGLDPRWLRAMEINWPGVRGMDIGRTLDDGTLVGCTIDEWVKGMIAGRFELGREVELLEACLAPCRDAWVGGADGKADRAIVLNCEPSSDVDSYQRPESLERRAGESDASLAYRRARAADVCAAWEAVCAEPRFRRRLAALSPRALECGPETWGDPSRRTLARLLHGRLFHAAKVATLRELLRLGGLLIPGTRVVPSFCRFARGGAGLAVGDNHEPLPALTPPRDAGVSWCGNHQRYRRDAGAVARSALFAETSTGEVWTTTWALDSDVFAGILEHGCRGGVVVFIDEPLRAEAEGRRAYQGEQATGSESWMADQAALLVRDFREGPK